MGTADRDDMDHIGDVMRLKNTLMRLLDWKKPRKPAVSQAIERGTPEPSGKVVTIGQAPARRSRLHRFEHATPRNIRPLASMSADEIVLAARAKGRKLTRAEAEIVKKTAGDAVAEDVEQVMYRHGFFSS